MNRKSTTVAYLGMLTALAMILSYVESLIPMSVGIPGVKIGLANLVVMVALYTVGIKWAFALSMVRIILVGFTFGSMSSMMYSFAGGMLSFLVMVIAKKTGFFSVRGVSILGGVFHNVGQIALAICLVENVKLVFYFPVLLVSGTAAGVAIGILATMIIVRVKKVYRNDEDKMDGAK
ncbi:MAG: Gx transporter family protein [Lachnospiraceae bacterium]|nr:Gx transporter family protein [Lachnospiraceae bacterium]